MLALQLHHPRRARRRVRSKNGSAGEGHTHTGRAKEHGSTARRGPGPSRRRARDVFFELRQEEVLLSAVHREREAESAAVPRPSTSLPMYSTTASEVPDLALYELFARGSLYDRPTDGPTDPPPTSRTNKASVSLILSNHRASNTSRCDQKVTKTCSM